MNLPMYDLIQRKHDVLLKVKFGTHPTRPSREQVLPPLVLAAS